MANRSNIAGLLIGVAVVFLLLLPAPFVIERPGTTLDTLGKVNLDGETVPVIAIDDAQTYEVDGELRLVTVSLLGSPDHKNRWFEVIGAYLDPKQKIVPMDDIYPQNVTAEDREEQNQRLMDDSQVMATAAALTALEIDFTSAVKIIGVQEDAPAAGVLEAGDTVLKINGQKIVDSFEMSKTIADLPIGSTAVLDILRDGVESQVKLVTADLHKTGRSAVGVFISTDFDFPINPEIALDKIGGPSAGLVFSLGILESLTETNFVDDLRVTATGTISAGGKVGAIGGLEQKIWAAEKSKSDIFLMPAANCYEVPKKLPKNMQIFPVETLTDALAAIQSYETEAKTSVSELCQSFYSGTNG